MAVLPILRWPDPMLATKCTAVDEANPTDLIADLFETMYAAAGRGLAAPQVGVAKRVFVMDAGWKDDSPSPEAFVDPVITVTAQECATEEEGCLSIPGLPVPVNRPVAVTLRWRDGNGDFHMRDFDGFEARCIQHEIDHLNGLVSLDQVDPDLRPALEQEYSQ